MAGLCIAARFVDICNYGVILACCDCRSALPPSRSLIGWCPLNGGAPHRLLTRALSRGPRVATTQWCPLKNGWCPLKTRWCPLMVPTIFDAEKPTCVDYTRRAAVRTRYPRMVPTKKGVVPTNGAHYFLRTQTLVPTICLHENTTCVEQLTRGATPEAW